jgi:hypothetical protein
VIVLVLLGVIGGMAIPHIDVDRYTAEAGVRITRSTLQSAQRSAILRQTNVIVVFDSATSRVITIEDANNNDQQDSGERATARKIADGARFVAPTTPLAGCGTAAVNGPSLLTVGNLPAISFLRDGASNSDLCLYITAGHDRSGTVRAVRVEHATGRSELWHFDGSTWVRGDA